MFTKIFQFDFIQKELISLQRKYFQSNFIKKNYFYSFNLQIQFLLKKNYLRSLPTKITFNSILLKERIYLFFKKKHFFEQFYLKLAFGTILFKKKNNFLNIFLLNKEILGQLLLNTIFLDFSKSIFLNFYKIK